MPRSVYFLSQRLDLQKHSIRAHHTHHHLCKCSEQEKVNVKATEHEHSSSGREYNAILEATCYSVTKPEVPKTVENNDSKCEALTEQQVDSTGTNSQHISMNQYLHQSLPQQHIIPQPPQMCPVTAPNYISYSRFPYSSSSLHQYPYHIYPPHPNHHSFPAILDPHQRKLRKNAQSRHRAAILRSKISTLKRVTKKTPQEEALVDKYEQRRLTKNDKTRQRAAEKKALLESIQSKPENKRSAEELETLRIAMAKRKRKNEGDRLRRVKMKEMGLSSKPPGVEIRGHDNSNSYDPYYYQHLEHYEQFVEGNGDDDVADAS